MNRTRVIAFLLLGVVLGLILLIVVGGFMVSSTVHQNDVIDRLDEDRRRERLNDVRAQEDRDRIIEGNARVQAVTDCIIAGPPPPFRDCLAQRLPAPPQP